MTIADLHRWQQTSIPGNVYEYHRGFMAMDCTLVQGISGLRKAASKVERRLRLVAG